MKSTTRTSQSVQDPFQERGPAGLPRFGAPWVEELETRSLNGLEASPLDSLARGYSVGKESGDGCQFRGDVDRRNLVSLTPTHNSIVAGSVIGGHYSERTIRIPKRVVHEEVVEKTFVIPETIRREEIVETVQTVKERVIEVAKPVVTEEVVEVPEVVYVDKIVEVPHVVVQEKLVEVPKVEVQERVRKVHKVVQRETVVEVPEIEYHDVIVEKTVEIPQIHEEIQVRENLVPRYLVREVPQYVQVEKPYEVFIKIPVPMKCSSVVEFEFPSLIPRVVKYKYPVYLPRFIEVPVAQHVIAPNTVAQLQFDSDRTRLLKDMQDPVSLCEVETLATAVKQQLESPETASALTAGETLAQALTRPVKQQQQHVQSTTATRSPKIYK